MSYIEREAFEHIRRLAWDAVGTDAETEDKALVAIHEFAKEQAASQAPASGEPVAVLNESRCFSLEDANRVMRLPPGAKLYTHPPAKVPEGFILVPTPLVERWANVDAFNAPKGAAMELKIIAQHMLTTPTPATTPETEWVKCADRLPEHGQKVRSRGKDGREFETEYFCYDGQTPRFKLIGKVWDHDNVVEWTATPPQEQ